MRLRASTDAVPSALTKEAELTGHGIDWVRWFREHIAGDLPRYARERWVYNTPIWEVIQRRFPAGARILECGSGAGTYGASLARFGYEVTGVDLDPAMVELARENAAVLGAEVRFEQGSILDLSAYHGRYDLAYSSGVIEHFRHDDAVRVLREEALCAPHVLVVVPTKYVWAREAPTTPGIFERYTVGRLRRVVREAGLASMEEIAFSAGSRVGRAVELLAPPLVSKRVFPHFASTVGILARSSVFRPA